jgi:hypothetical protein
LAFRVGFVGTTAAKVRQGLLDSANLRAQERIVSGRPVASKASNHHSTLVK